MKKTKLLLLAAIIVFPTISAFAGDDEGGKKGIRAGWQMSNFYSDGNSVGDNLSSFYIGVFGEKKLIPLLSLGVGLEYSSNGSTQNSPDAKYVRHIISLPVYLKVKLGPVFALAGTAANFGVADKFSIEGENIDLNDILKTNVFNLPIYMGIGVKVSIISIEARYHLGLLDLDKTDNSSKTTQYFQLGAAVSF